MKLSSNVIVYRVLACASTIFPRKTSLYDSNGNKKVAHLRQSTHIFLGKTGVGGGKQLRSNLLSVQPEA